MLASNVAVYLPCWGVVSADDDDVDNDDDDDGDDDDDDDEWWLLTCFADTLLSSHAPKPIPKSLLWPSY